MSEEIDDNDLIQLEAEIPALSRVKRFADALDRIQWFANLGEEASQDTAKLCLDYADALGFPEAEMAILPSWEDAASTAETLDFANPAWEVEELARADLTMRAMDFMSEEALSLALNMVADKASNSIKSALADEMAIWDIEDEALTNLAVGSAIQSVHNAALMLVVAAADTEFDAQKHLFSYKFKLFEQGRWPVGVLGSSLNLF